MDQMITVSREMLRQIHQHLEREWKSVEPWSLDDSEVLSTALQVVLEQPAVEPVAWVNPANLISAAIERARGGQGDTHTWSETRTAYHSVGLVPATQTPQQPQLLTDEEYTALAHRTASKYTHRSDPDFTGYTFLPHTLEQFTRAIEQASLRKNRVTGCQ